MKGLRAAEQRYGFQFPPVYRTLLADGHLNPGGRDALQLTDLEWLTPTAIAAYRLFEPPAYPLIPFAMTARVDEWCWRLDWADEGGEPPVAFRERGGPTV